MENPINLSDNDRIIHANNSTICNNCIINNNYTYTSTPTAGHKRKRLNPGRADNEVNGSKGDRLEDVLEETIRKYDNDAAISIYTISAVYAVLEEKIKQQDVQWTTNKLAGGVRPDARDNLYKHFEVLEEDVEDIRNNLRKEESVVDEFYKVLNRGLRVKVQRTREYLLRKLFQQDENLARSFIEYLIEEMISESNLDPDRRENGGSCHFPPLYIQSATNDEAART